MRFTIKFNEFCDLCRVLVPDVAAALIPGGRQVHICRGCLSVANGAYAKHCRAVREVK